MMIDRIDLLPRSYRERHEVSVSRVGIITGAFILIFILMGVYLYQTVKVRSLHKELALAKQTEQRMNQEYARLRDMVARMEMLQKDTSELKRRVDIIDNLIEKRVEWSRILKKISILVPEEVWLSSLNASGQPDDTKGLKRIIIKGYALSNDVLADFIAGLDKTGFFRATDLSYVRLIKWKESEVFEFGITTDFSMG